MSPEIFMRRDTRRGPRTAGEWIALIIAVAAAVAVDSLLKKHFPDMAPRLRRGLSSLATIVVLLIYFFVIRE
ncbi:MAG: hypothetical protein ACI4Q6_08890 [Huintestinicola sp.]